MDKSKCKDAISYINQSEDFNQKTIAFLKKNAKKRRFNKQILQYVVAFAACFLVIVLIFEIYDLDVPYKKGDPVASSFHNMSVLMRVKESHEYGTVYQSTRTLEQVKLLYGDTKEWDSDDLLNVYEDQKYYYIFSKEGSLKARMLLAESDVSESVSLTKEEAKKLALSEIHKYDFKISLDEYELVEAIETPEASTPVWRLEFSNYVQGVCVGNIEACINAAGEVDSLTFINQELSKGIIAEQNIVSDEKVIEISLKALSKAEYQIDISEKKDFHIKVNRSIFNKKVVCFVEIENIPAYWNANMTRSCTVIVDAETGEIIQIDMSR